jgi:hypothetical protein
MEDYARARRPLGRPPGLLGETRGPGGRGGAISWGCPANSKAMPHLGLLGENRLAAGGVAENWGYTPEHSLPTRGNLGRRLNPKFQIALSVKDPVLRTPLTAKIL